MVQVPAPRAVASPSPLTLAGRRLRQSLLLALAAGLCLGLSRYAWPDWGRATLIWIAPVFLVLIAGAGCVGAAVYYAGSSVGHLANHFWTRASSRQAGWVERPHLWQDNYRFTCSEDLVELRTGPAPLSATRLLFFGLAAFSLVSAGVLSHQLVPKLLAGGLKTQQDWTVAAYAALALPGGVWMAALGFVLTSRRRLLLEAHGPLKVLREGRLGQPGEYTLPRESRLRVLILKTEHGPTWVVRVMDPEQPDAELSRLERLSRTLLSGTGQQPPQQLLDDVAQLDAALVRNAQGTAQRGGKLPEGEGNSFVSGRMRSSKSAGV